MAKQLVFDDEARDALYRGVSKLAKAVVSTLGPRGRNAVLDKGWGGPTITKDGVTASASSFNDKFYSACLAPDGLVVLAPFSADGIGLFNAETETFAWVDISATLGGSIKFRGATLAPNGLVVLSPAGAPLPPSPALFVCRELTRVLPLATSIATQRPATTTASAFSTHRRSPSLIPC